MPVCGGHAQGNAVRTFFIAATSALLVVAEGLHAQAIEASIADEVVVTATRIPQKLSESNQHVTVITAQEIASGGYSSLADILQARGGVEITNSGGRGQPSAVFIRGAEARHTLVLIDGLRIGSATAGGTAFEHLPLNQIDRIEIVPGAMSSLYGSDAIGGVIQIFTRKEGSGNSAKIGAGSYGTREASAAFGRRMNDTEFSLGVGIVESRGFDATKPNTPFGQHNSDSDGYRNRNFSARLAHALGGGDEVGLTAFHSEGAAHFDAGTATDDVNRQTLSAFSIYGRKHVASNWTSTLRLGSTRDHSSTVGAFPGFFQTGQRQAVWQNDVNIALGTLTGGIEYLGQQVKSDTVFKQTERTVKSVFGGYRGTFGAHHLQFNARHDETSQFGAHDTGLLGYSYRLTQALKIRAAGGTAFRAPTFNDLYFPDQAPFFFSNPNLRPERSRSREIGVDYEAGRQRLALTVFEQKIADLITIVTDPATFVSTTQNLDRVRIQGVEIAYQGVIDGWQTRADITLQDPKDEATGAQLRRRAREHGTFAAKKTFGPWALGAEVVAAGNRFDSTTEAPNSRMHGYALINLTAGYALTRDWSVNARWNNIFDREYELVQFFNTPGSNFFVWASFQSR
jgi:vitamin B12 transporter